MHPNTSKITKKQKEKKEKKVKKSETKPTQSSIDLPLATPRLQLRERERRREEDDMLASSWRWCCLKS